MTYRATSIRPRSLLWVLFLSLSLALAACGDRETKPNVAGAAAPTNASNSSAASTKTSNTTAAAPTPAPEQSAFPGAKLDTSAPKGAVGAKITILGTAFPANVDVALSWKTFEGRYVLEDNEVVFVGARYDERILNLGTVKADTGGAFRHDITVPEDFGGLHDIIARIETKFATKTGFTVTPSFSVSTTTGPIGTPITVKATGLGYRQQEAMWEVSWDNGFTGYLMGVTTRGTATGFMRMSGPPGTHVLKIWRNYRGIPYLNPHQGPFGKLPEPTTFLISVTDGVYQAANVTAHPNPADTVRPTPAAKSQGGASLTVTPDKGDVGSSITISGTGFPANQPVKLTWSTRTGQQITATGLREGFDEEIKDLPAVTADASGRFSTQLKVHDDYAGEHRITAASGGALAEAYYSIYASIVEFTAQAKVGEDVNIRMKGVGWTIQGKTYAINYDNVYLGYGCSFSTKGDIDLHLPAAGAPGVHIIDLYPAVYEGLDPTPNIYSRPNLTYLDNHPGGVLPAFRLTLVVTP